MPTIEYNKQLVESLKGKKIVSLSFAYEGADIVRISFEDNSTFEISSQYDEELNLKYHEVE